MPNKIYSIAYFVSHPIQYQAPLLKLISEQTEIDLHVFFLANPAQQNHQDEGFNQPISWDIPLLEGYRHSFLNSKLSPGHFSLNNPRVSIKAANKAFKLKKWDVIWLHGYNNFAMLYVLWRSKNQNIPIFYRSDSTLLTSRPKFLKNIFIKWLVKNSQALLWTSSENKEYYQYYGAALDKLYFSPHAVNNPYFQSFARKPNNQKNKCILLFASKFIKRKKASLLLDAFNQLDPIIRSNAELWFVGDGDERSVLEEKIRTFELANYVKLIGFKNQSEMPLVLAQCNVFILPSEKEPFGLIINEAMNLGKAIITTDEVGAARDLVSHKENGWVIPANDIGALKNALHDAITDPEQLIKMGRSSLQKINRWSYTEDIEGLQASLNHLSEK